MIILLLILATFVFAGAMIFGHASLTRNVTIAISFIIIVGSLIGLAGNDTAHWGMHQVTTTTIEDLVPVRSQRAALLNQPLGTGSEKTVIYRVTNAAKPSHTVADATTTTKITTGSAAQVQIATTRWEYRNHAVKTLFHLGAGKAAVVSRHYVFTIPTSWTTVTLKAKN